MPKAIFLKKGEESRLQRNHPWVFSNEIDTSKISLQDFTPGDIVDVYNYQEDFIARGYVNPKSLITIRLLSKERIEYDAVFFYRRLQVANSFRERMLKQPFYRMVYGEADHLPGLIIDRYGDHFAVQLNTAGIEKFQATILEELQKLFPNLKSILLRNDSATRKIENLELVVTAGFGEPPKEIFLQENGVQFAVPFLSGQKTGWFFDQRSNRRHLQDYVVNRKVLDVFSYLGGFGVQAACFGAEAVTTIDASEIACQYIAKNAALNKVQSKVTILQGQAMHTLNQLYTEKKYYDVIILDPPALIKKAKDRRAGLIAYQRLNEKALRLLKPNGVLITCSCSMHLSMQDLTHVLHKAAVKTKTDMQILERGHQAIDHPIALALPEMEYLKAIFARKVVT